MLRVPYSNDLLGSSQQAGFMRINEHTIECRRFSRLEEKTGLRLKSVINEADLDNEKPWPKWTAGFRDSGTHGQAVDGLVVSESSRNFWRRQEASKSRPRFVLHGYGSQDLEDATLRYPGCRKQCHSYWAFIAPLSTTDGALYVAGQRAYSGPERFHHGQRGIGETGTIERRRRKS